MAIAKLKASAPATIAGNAPRRHHQCWTAAEVFMAIAPHRTNQLSDPAAALAPQTRSAHFIAVRDGFGWNADGRYPLDVWMQIAD